jgi:hypothetical protein
MVREKPSDSTVQVGLGPHDALWLEGKSSMEISRCSLGIIHSWRGGGLELGFCTAKIRCWLFLRKLSWLTSGRLTYTAYGDLR